MSSLFLRDLINEFKLPDNPYSIAAIQNTNPYRYILFLKLNSFIK